MTPVLTPYALRVESLTDPIGLDEPAPRFSWRLQSDHNDVDEIAYRLVVSSAAGTVWDTGRVAGRHDLLVPYAGPPLAPHTDYRWQVHSWADGEEPGTSSATFSTGHLGSAWQAAWIGRDSRNRPAMLAPVSDDLTWNSRSCSAPSLLRREFAVRDVRRARLYVTARGLYDAHVNGVRVQDSCLDPGWTDYRFRVNSRCFDVTDLVVDGDNALAIELADGWYSGFVGFRARRGGQVYGEAPMLLAQLRLDLRDGSTVIIGTDEQWREASSHRLYADLLMGEGIDARREQHGWNRAGFDDSQWRRARVLDTDTSTVVAATVPPIRPFATLKPVATTERDGAVIIDFGQNLVGHVRVRLTGTAGQCIEILHGEALTDDGQLYTENLRRAEARDLYYCAGDGTEVFEPRFTFHGFRYARIAGLSAPPGEGDVVAIAVSSDLDQVGAFTSNSDDVNAIVSNTWWSQRGNFLSVPTDCPQRDERLGWLADAQVYAPTSARFADVGTFFASWMQDVLAAQTPEGAFTDIAPSGVWAREGAPAWGDAGTIIPMAMYQRYGDRALLADCFPAMVRWVEFIEAHNPTLIWTARTGNNYGDWLHTGPETDRDLVATAYFALSARLTAQAAGILGQQSQEARFTDLAERIAAAFTERFLDGSTLTSDTQTAYLLALDHDLVPTAARDALVARLVELVEQAGTRLTTGFIGVSKLCRVLSEHGHDDLALRLLAQDAYPSWLFPIRHGATTIWERWDGWTPDGGFGPVTMNSFNHYSLGAVVDWIYGRVGGIDAAPGAVGYSQVVIAPRPGAGVSTATTSLQTPRGLVATDWAVTAEAFTIAITTPPGVASVFDPPPGFGAPQRLPSGHHTITIGAHGAQPGGHDASL